MSSKRIAFWERAADLDKTLKVGNQDLFLLKKKRVTPIPYSRLLMFSRMAKGQISLFNNLKVPVSNDSGNDLRSVLTNGISTGFPKSRTARIQMGRSGRRCRMRVAEVMRRWQSGRTILSVTDLHFRGTKFYEVINTSALSNFNILCTDLEFSSEFMESIEMMTLVVSSEGNLTDNHADDCDGTNHCFLGRKLWLAWDRLEGKAAGFEDVDRDKVLDQAAFDIKAFLSLPSSRWFTVEPGQTLFLPGSLAHKVITLEHYIGAGSFHVALPSYIRSLKRWILYDTHDIGPQGLLEKINVAVMRRIHKLQGAPQSVRESWGVSSMKKAIQLWDKTESLENKAALLRHPAFASFHKTGLGA